MEKRRRWALAAKLDSLDTVGPREPSEHLGGGTERSVRVNALAASYRNQAGRVPMPQGALIVQLHHPPGDDGLIAGFVMLKGPAGSAPAQDDWSFVVLDEQLRVEAEGPMPLCASCHGAAPHDRLFGPPAAVGPPSSEP